MNANQSKEEGGVAAGKELYCDKLHTIKIPSVHVTDFQLDLRLGSRGVLHQLMLCSAKNARA